MIRFFAEHPTAANLLMAALLISGLMVLPSMQRETMPEIEQFEVQVSVAYLGASAGEMLVIREGDGLVSLNTDLPPEVLFELRNGCFVVVDIPKVAVFPKRKGHDR